MKQYTIEYGHNPMPDNNGCFHLKRDDVTIGIINQSFIYTAEMAKYENSINELINFAFMVGYDFGQTTHSTGEKDE